MDERFGVSISKAPLPHKHRSRRLRRHGITDNEEVAADENTLSKDVTLHGLDGLTCPLLGSGCSPCC